MWIFKEQKKLDTLVVELEKTTERKNKNLYCFFDERMREGRKKAKQCPFDLNIGWYLQNLLLLLLQVSSFYLIIFLFLFFISG